MMWTVVWDHAGAQRAIEGAAHYKQGGRLIPQSTQIIICEGNYLLAKQPPWDRLKSIFDLNIFVDVPVEDLRRRLEDRWHGFGLSPEEITRKVEGNDLPNGLFIMSNSAEPELRVNNGG